MYFSKLYLEQICVISIRRDVFIYFANKDVTTLTVYLFSFVPFVNLQIHQVAKMSPLQLFKSSNSLYIDKVAKTLL